MSYRHVRTVQLGAVLVSPYERPSMSTLLLTEEQKERHLITRLDAAQHLTFKQLTHAKAALVQAGLSSADAVLLGAALQALVANMHADGDGVSGMATSVA